MPLLFNEKNTIRTQLFVSFIVILIVTGAVTLGICYGLLFKMGSDAYQTSKSTIADVTRQSLDSYAKELSLSLAQQLNVITSTTCLASSLYARLLNEHMSVAAYKLREQMSFREYKFEDSSCTYPDCPLDFGSLRGKIQKNINSFSIG
jgi:hypothetical protein